MYKPIRKISSIALRFGCSKFGLNPQFGKPAELVFLFSSLSYFVFISWLIAKDIKFTVKVQNGFYIVYVPVTLLTVWKKVLFQNFRFFVRSFGLYAKIGYEANWEVAEVNRRQRANLAKELHQTQWGKNHWYEQNLLSTM